MSWPQACITGTCFPVLSVAVSVLAYGKPVSSCTGSASMSARSMTVGPSPLRSTPTTPVLPDARRHFKAGGAKPIGSNARRSRLLHREFGMCVDVGVDPLEVGQQVADS